MEILSSRPRLSILIDHLKPQSLLFPTKPALTSHFVLNESLSSLRGENNHRDITRRICGAYDKPLLAAFQPPPQANEKFPRVSF